MMPKPTVIAFAAAVLLPLGAWTGHWTLASIAALIVVVLWGALIRERASARRGTDGRQRPLDPDPFEPADSDGFAERVDGGWVPEEYRNNDPDAL